MENSKKIIAGLLVASMSVGLIAGIASAGETDVSGIAQYEVQNQNAVQSDPAGTDIYANSLPAATGDTSADTDVTAATGGTSADTDVTTAAGDTSVNEYASETADAAADKSLLSDDEDEVSYNEGETMQLDTSSVNTAKDIQTEAESNDDSEETTVLEENDETTEVEIDPLMAYSSVTISSWIDYDSDITEPSSGCLLVEITGSYYSDAQAALDRINQIRYEACTAGNVPNPSNPSVMLQPSDYVPMHWSTNLEIIARRRAPESSLTMAHTTLTKNNVYDHAGYTLNGERSQGETIAWNWASGLLMGIEQWYSEKDNWVSGEGGATGHYTAMINPKFTSVGLASFYSDEAVYGNTVVGEYGSSTGSESAINAYENVGHIMDVSLDYISEYEIEGYEDGMELQKNESITLELLAGVTVDAGTYYLPVRSTLTYTSSDPNVIAVSGNGTISGRAKGKSTITISYEGTELYSFEVTCGHSEVKDPAVAATCTTAGKTAGSHCSTCGTIIVAQTEIPAKGHTETVSKAGTAATLFTTGTTDEIVCSVCGQVVKKQTTIYVLNLEKTLCRGMKGEQVKQVQEKLAELGYLSATPDGVFGAKTEAAVREFQKANGLASPDGMVGNWTLNKLRNNGDSTVIILTRTLKKGMTGSDVKQVQQRLKDLGYLTSTPDGVFGAQTEAAVREFQIANGLGYSDGMVGNWTAGKLNGSPVAKSASNTSGSTTTKITLTRTLKKGMTGTDVMQVQKRLAELGYLTSTPDGVFGAKTESAVRTFQIINGLGYSDGMVGNWTVGKLNGNPVTVFTSTAK